MRRHSRRGRATRLLALLVIVLLASAAFAQGLSDEELEILKQLPADERAELLRSYGISTTQQTAAPDRDVTTPALVAPRAQPVSDLERSVRQVTSEDAIGARARLMKGYPGRPGQGVGRTMEQAQPLEVDVKLTQFGYELFAGAPTTFAPATDIPVSADYIIGPGDEIHVQLYGGTNLTADLTVDRDGVLAFPELGPLTVAGLSFREMKEHVAREVENRMIGVDVSVSMGRLRSIRVFVLGEVFQPGSYLVSGLATLTNALFASGGVQKVGSLRRVELRRAGVLIQEMDLYDLLLRGDTSKDERLMPGDVIFVPPVGAVVGVAGEILRPALYEMNGPLTARQIIELAGGLLPTAYTELIQLERIEGGKRVTYDMGLEGSKGWSLQNGDIVKVYPILDREEEVVFFDGSVLRPGKRQYYTGMRISDLVGSTTALLPETYFGYGLIERENPLNREPEYLAFDLGAVLIDGNPDEDLFLEPRDRVYVFHRNSFQETPGVSVRGEVRSPGDYAFGKEMRVLDLVLAAGGLTRDAWLREAELFRTNPATLDVTKIPIDLGSVLDADPWHNRLLQNMDELAVHSIWEFKTQEQVEILGEVNHPGTYPLFDGMRVADLIFAGGNTKETAYLGEAELTRYQVVDGERRDLRHIVLDLGAILERDVSADLVLHPYDRLLVRRIGNWRADAVVHVYGEVAFPGSYPIEEGERLSHLIERFGGFLEDAYHPAAVFTREQVRSVQAEQLERMANVLEADLARLTVSNPRSTSGTDQARHQAALEAGNQLLAELKNATASGRMVVQLDTAERLAGTQDDVVLADGDRLHVPKRPDFVIVTGQVHNPTAFKFEKNRRASHYIRLAGGKTRFGDSRGTYVIKADGSVQTREGAAVCPGDVIIVPEKLERFAGMQFVLDISQVLYQLGLAAASAHTLGLF